MNPLGISVVRADGTYVYAKYYYYEGPTVYIEITSINSASGNKWRVRGRDSYNDSDVYLEGKGVGVFTFDSIDNYSYILQIQNGNGDWVNTTNAYDDPSTGNPPEYSIINVAFESGGHGDGESGDNDGDDYGDTTTGHYYMYIDQGVGTNLSVVRTWSDNSHYVDSPGDGIMTNGEPVWYGTDVFEIDVSALEGYDSPTWQSQNLTITSDGRYTMSYPGNIYVSSSATSIPNYESSNTFIKRNAYIGVNNIARKIKECYVGVSGVARRVRMAFVGVGGVARPIMADGNIVYYGEISPIGGGDNAGHHVTGTKLSSRALIFSNGSGAFMNVYTELLLRYFVSIPDDMHPYGRLTAATNIGDYAIFTGHTNSGSVITEFAYNISMEMQILSQPNIGSASAATHVGDYALFAPNNNRCTSVYDKHLTKYADLYMSNNAYGCAATHVGDYAIFAGGENESSGIDAFDSSLSRNGNIEGLTIGGCPTASYAGGNALFYITKGDLTAGYMDVYNSSLEKILNIEPLDVCRSDSGAVHIGDYALFSGGVIMDSWGYTSSADTDLYDTYLTRSTTTSLTTARCQHIGVEAGSFAIFAGGRKWNSVGLSSVEAYALI